MNFNPSFLTDSGLFWVVLAVMFTLMVAPMVVARRRGWL
ncbi:hypothetical protein BH24ACT5_BH24ACT5_19860 [soil metagenome]